MWRPILAGCVLCALAGGLLAQGRDPFPSRARPKAKPTPTPTPAPVVKRAPANAPVVKRAPLRPFVPKPAPRTVAEVSTPPVASGPRSRNESPNREIDSRPVVLEPSSVRRFLSMWQPRLVASEEYLAVFRERLKEGRAENAKIAADRTLALHTTEENRKLGPLLTAGGEAYGRRDWLAQLRAANAAPTPLNVEEALRKAETIAFRTQTFSGETKGLLGKAQHNLSGTASGALWTDLATTGGLIVPNLRIIRGAVHDAPEIEPYALQNLDSLRSGLSANKASLAGQYLSARREWQQWLARGEDLNRRYTELRFTPPAE